MTATKKKTAAVGADRAEYRRRRRRHHPHHRHRPRLYRHRRKERRLDLRCLSSRRRRLSGVIHHTHEPRVIMPPYLETIIYAVQTTTWSLEEQNTSRRSPMRSIPPHHQNTTHTISDVNKLQ